MLTQRVISQTLEILDGYIKKVLPQYKSLELYTAFSFYFSSAILNF